MSKDTGLIAVLAAYGVEPTAIEPFGSGLINTTWKVTAGVAQFVLQQINTTVFRNPIVIARNLLKINRYLQRHFPDYLFISPLATEKGEYLLEYNNEVYRLLPFVKNSYSFNYVTDEKQAYEAARQFGTFTRLLKEFDVSTLEYTLKDFHNLALRYEQFENAIKKSHPMRAAEASVEIQEMIRHKMIYVKYQEVIGRLPLRVIHHDTKINNVLFDKDNNGICVIDLDTVMPGSFLSDVGDMMRTYLSPADEEEIDLDKVLIRSPILNAVVEGYLTAMGDTLSEVETSYLYYGGEFMIYMQALRFLTDHLNGDIYYRISRPGQNLDRARNQLSLLVKYQDATSRNVESRKRML
jgi:thiamine kinase-like enzyme